MNDAQKVTFRRMLAEKAGQDIVILTKELFKEEDIIIEAK